MDTAASFQYNPPDLPSSSFSPLAHSTMNPQGDHYAHTRPGSSSGATATAGFTQTLAPLHEQPAAEAGRPTLVGFEELAGEDLNAPGSSHGLAGGCMPFGGHDGLGGAVGATSGAEYGGLASSEAITSMAPPAPSASYSAATASHSAQGQPFFNPQTVHPSVNTRNTRPMTAPSGPNYFGSSYSAAPSSFYAPSQQYDALSLAPPGSSAGGATFQYQVDHQPNPDYDNFRTRGFSLPDVATSGIASDPALGLGGAEDASPTGNQPFFYTPPQTQTGAVRPVTAGAAYYPTMLDPSVTPVYHPLLPATSAGLPTVVGLPDAGAASSMPRRTSVGSASGKTYNFVQQAGGQTKRPRRRYDEIERLYNCDYPGCTKAYGTLNHLNSHKMMQKHGPKSTPAQFKEMRKAWRERKKAEAAAAARERAANPPPDPLPNPASAIPAFGMQGSERPRPSTSAGEYYFSMPAPFMTPVGAPVVAYGQPATATALPLPAQSSFLDPNGAPAYDMYGAADASIRPVTAPSYYVAPAFGSSAAAAYGVPSHPNPPNRPTYGASYMVGGPPSLGAAASADRRLSLPGGSSNSLLPPPPPSTSASAPRPHTGHGHSGSPEMRMPQPVHGYQQHALVGGSAGAGLPPSRSNDSVASLGLATGGGGAAKLVLDHNDAHLGAQ
ncbi:hypothetical protein JCM10207_008100 [Rhodosporidiobolus poonsookiae]